MTTAIVGNQIRRILKREAGQRRTIVMGIGCVLVLMMMVMIGLQTTLILKIKALEESKAGVVD